MAQSEVTAVGLDWKAQLGGEQDFMRCLVQEVVQQVLEAEMDEALQAGKGERTESRQGYRSGYYSRTLVTRVGRLELRVPQDRQGRFSTQVFERYQRSEKALVLALAEMYVQGVSTRKVKAITEELCGHAFSASAVSDITRKLDEQLSQFASRRLDEEYPYLILDARYERVREGGVIRSRAVLIAIGINWDGRRCRHRAPRPPALHDPPSSHPGQSALSSVAYAAPTDAITCRTGFGKLSKERLAGPRDRRAVRQDPIELAGKPGSHFRHSLGRAFRKAGHAGFGQVVSPPGQPTDPGGGLGRDDPRGDIEQERAHGLALLPR